MYMPVEVVTLSGLHPRTHLRITHLSKGTILDRTFVVGAETHNPLGQH